MDRLVIPEAVSAGLFLTYKCTSVCKHCLYACSPGWKADWIPLADAERVLSQLAPGFRRRDRPADGVGINQGLHLTGGEPFLNFELLLQLAGIAHELGIPSTFVETNCFWCTDDETGREKLTRLRQAGLHGILISVNPFILEQVPFANTERAVRLSAEVFGPGAMVYQQYFYGQFRSLGLTGTLPFEQYVQQAGHVLAYAELLPSGRLPYALGHLFRTFPASEFFAASCRDELMREWHVHVDNHCHYVPGYCGGLSLGDARYLYALTRGIDLADLRVIRALLSRLEDLYRLGLTFGYKELAGYVSKCHLCVDIRRHLAQHGEFPELVPQAFYRHLEESR